MSTVQIREQVRYTLPKNPCMQPGKPIFVMDGGAKENVGPSQPSYCVLEKGHEGPCFFVCASDKRIIPEVPF